MSFEDNMIDDGFYDEIDYMDYLMNRLLTMRMNAEDLII